MMHRRGLLRGHALGRRSMEDAARGGDDGVGMIRVVTRALRTGESVADGAATVGWRLRVHLVWTDARRSLRAQLSC
jgi:hypothetical protein